jgi:hypothetical protein
MVWPGAAWLMVGRGPAVFVVGFVDFISHLTGGGALTNL